MGVLENWGFFLMGVSQNDGRMEGWLFLIRSNRFGLQYSRKRYFVLEDHYLKSFKSVPISKDEVHDLLSFPMSWFWLI